MCLSVILWIFAIDLVPAIGWFSYVSAATDKWSHWSDKDRKKAMWWKADAWIVILFFTSIINAIVAAILGQPWVLATLLPMIAAIFVGFHIGKLHPLPDPDPRPAGV